MFEFSVEVPSHPSKALEQLPSIIDTLFFVRWSVLRGSAVLESKVVPGSGQLWARPGHCKKVTVR